MTRLRVCSNTMSEYCIPQADIALAVFGTLCVTHAQQPSGRDIAVFPIGPLVAISNPEYAFQEVYFLRASGVANSVGIGTTAGTVLIDTKSPGWGPAVLSALQQVTDMPVTTIINTHGHDDHAGANGEYPQPVEIVMHENTRNRLKIPSMAMLMMTTANPGTWVGAKALRNCPISGIDANCTALAAGLCQSACCFRAAGFNPAAHFYLLGLFLSGDSETVSDLAHG